MKKLLLQIILAVLCIVCLAYGAVVRGVGSGNRFWMVWWAGALFFALLFVLTARRLWRRIPRGLLYAGIGICAAGLLYVIVCSAFIFSHFHDRGEEGADVIIVLGAQVYPSGPSIILQHRLDTALDYLYAHPDTRCIVTGGQGENEHAPEAEVMREYLVANGIDSARILTETESKNTIGNITNCLSLIDAENDSVGIITNDFHLFRSLSIAQKQGIRNVSGIAAPSRVFYYPHNILRECVGILKDKLLGNM
ncbi:MAG: YdcF family protein [Lachnospiraceae bacterium]|nr:YdcF family protein [Lachnospiraceae bacterium]